MQSMINAYRRIALFFAALGGVLILAAVAIVAAEILLRKLFSTTIGGADEIAGYLFATATAFSLAHVVVERGNVRVDILYAQFPGALQRVSDLVAAAAMFAFAGALFWFGFDVWRMSLRLDSVSNSAIAVPLALPQGAWLIGLALFVAVQLSILALAAILAVRGRGVEAEALAGLRSAADEAVAETVAETVAPARADALAGAHELRP